ncbi:MAG: PstS family phosphate ABC transporter substrate-binding protein [Gloeocapsa sp. DLM2.Bin57]|nr:MAG: PstS family phosphate ABC transporter substrate-binding protein [Gloeocapsa sp. DLM2.Bin57]
MNINKHSFRKILTGVSLTALTLGLIAPGSIASVKQEISGDIAIDGSSTVFPVTEAMAEEFQIANPGVRVTVGISGSGGGFKKFCAGETDISNASRPIKTSEMEECAQAGIEFIELPIAFDALSVVVNPNNDWAECLTVEELNTMWATESQGTVTNWNQIREGFPDRPLTLYGPGVDSGTFDYFTDAINGAEGDSRGDFTASEDDNVIVLGVAQDENALGFFGLAYLEENRDTLRAVKIDEGNGCVEPSVATVEDGTYQPLARPIFIYVRKSSLERPEVKAFVDFYLAPENMELVSEVGYIALPAAVNEKARNRLNSQTTGTIFEGGSTVGVNLNEVL